MMRNLLRSKKKELPIKIGLLFFILLFGSFTQVFGQTNTWDGSSSNNWNTATNWSLGHVPLAVEDVIIPNSFNVTVNTAAVCKTFTFNDGNRANTITISNGQSLSVVGAVSIGAGTGSGDNKIIAVGTGAFSCASITVAATTNANRSSGVTISSGTVTVLGNITMGDVNDNITFSGAGTLNVGGTMSGGDLISAAGSIVNYNGTSPQTVAINANYVYTNLHINNTTGATLQATVTTSNVTGNIRVQTGTLNNGGFAIAGSSTDTFEVLNGATFNVGGTTSSFPSGFGTFILESSSTVGYTGSGDQAVSSKTYGNLTLSGGGIKTAGGAIIVSTGTALNGVTFKSGATTGYNSSLGVLSMGSNSTIALGTTSHTLTFTNSSAASWTGTLIITGWTGTGGSSGTAGKIVVGVGGLTAAQLAKVSFSGYPAGAQILVSGELVPKVSAPVLTITGSTDHGSSCVATAASTIQYTITNTGAAASGVTVTSNNSQFVVSGAPTTVAAGGTATYNVTFAPVSVGAQSATITVASTTSGSNSPTSLLTGTGNPLPTTTITPSPADAASDVCYSGAGAVNSVSWAAVSGATSYDVYFGAGSLPGTVTSNVLTNSYDTGTLSANTTYYWKVVPKNACGDATGSSTWTFATTGASCVTVCNPMGINSNGQVDWISKIDIGSFSKASVAFNYSDYTSDVISLARNTNQTITLTPGFSSSSFDEYWRVWIDLNKDGDYLDFGELLYSGNSTGAITNSINIPDVTVNTTMRIAMKRYNTEDLTIPGGNVTALYSNDSPAGEEIGKLVDNVINQSNLSKYLTFHASGWVQYQFNNGERYIVTKYSMTSANDAPERDPLNWTLSGSNDGSNWTTLDTRSGVDFADRWETREFSFTNKQAFEYYRLQMTNNSGNILQIGEWELFENATYPEPCEPFAYGEVEDYTVNIAPACVDGTSSLISPIGTDAQTVCINTPIASITYAIGGGATGATVTGLPTGVTSSFRDGIITISGSPVVSSTYTITTTGTPNPCTEAIITGSITVNPLPTVTWSGALTNQCIGSISYTLTGGSPIGGTYSGTGVTGTNFDATTAGAGTKTLTYTYTDANGCTNTATNTITVNAIPTTPTATNNGPVCEGLPLTLNTPTVTGAIYSWKGPNSFTSALQNPTIATTTTAAIGTYSVTVTVNGCTSLAGTTIATVNSNPSAPAITGTNNICVGLATALITTATGTIVWSSSNTSAAIIDSNTGVVTGLASGTTNITYTVTNGSGCFTTSAAYAVTVNAIPTAPLITGTNSVCVGLTTALSTTATGTVVWSSSNTSAATVVSSTGVVTGVAAGTTNITYTVTNGSGCSTTSAAYAVTVNSNPPASGITGTNSVCVGLTTALSTTATGTIVWSSSNTSAATVVSSTGVVTGVAAGTTNITYTVTNGYGCSTTSAAYQVTVIERINAKASANSSSTDCPDFSGPWNANTSFYDPGVSQVSFQITRESSTLNWGFHYELTGATVRTASPYSSPNPPSSTLSDLSVDMIELTFYIINTPGVIQDVKLNITAVHDDLCSEVTTSDNKASHTIKAMPAIGSFK